MVSIIVPVYNAAQYLDRCVESILAQTFSDWELLLIDDGSADTSGQVCDEFAKRDARIRTWHLQNGGAAYARNQGLDRAAGDFIVFVDADDHIPENHLEVLAKCQRDTEADMVVASIKYQPGPLISHRECVLTTEQLLEKMLYRDGMGDYPVSKLYRAEMFSDLRFTERITSEDFEIFYRLYCRAKTAAVTDQTVYYYMQNASSISNGGFSEKFFNRIAICEQLEQQIQAGHPALLPAMHSRILDEATWLAGILPKGYPEQEAWIRESIKQYRHEVLHDPKATQKVKQKVRLYSMMPGLYRYRGIIKKIAIKLAESGRANQFERKYKDGSILR